MLSVAGVIWAVAIWNGVKSPISQIAKVRKVRKKCVFLYIDFMVFSIHGMMIINSSNNTSYHNLVGAGSPKYMTPNDGLSKPAPTHPNINNSLNLTIKIDVIWGDWWVWAGLLILFMGNKIDREPAPTNGCCLRLLATFGRVYQDCL